MVPLPSPGKTHMARSPPGSQSFAAFSGPAAGVWRAALSRQARTSDGRRNLAAAVERASLGTRVIRLAKNLWDPDVIRTMAQMRFGFRLHGHRGWPVSALATYYTLRYIDIGVRLDAVRNGSKKGRIREVCGTINYLQPGRSSLMSRGLFTMAEVAAAGLQRNDPAAHAQEVRDGYITGVRANRPAVISVNMFAAALAVDELLARLHPFREEPNGNYATTIFSLASMELICEPDERPCEILADRVGIGDAIPLLGLLELSEKRAA